MVGWLFVDLFFLMGNGKWSK